MRTIKFDGYKPIYKGVPPFMKYEDGYGFYGGVKIYHGGSVEYKRCPIERKNRLKALEDSKKLLKSLRQK